MRLAGWEARLAVEFDRWARVPFVWGAADCFSFACACERAITGQGRFDDLPPYDSARSALRGLRRLGYPDPVDLISTRLSPVAPLMAARGDWIMRQDDAFAVCAFGVVAGRTVAHMSESGLKFLPLAGAAHAWKV